MMVTVRSFAKVNLGLSIGAVRADGFHALRTVYQTIALHDVIRVSMARAGGKGARSREIEILCSDPRVPLDASNTCYRMAERVLDALGVQGKVMIEIEKRLPVQGGLGAASSNAVATMIGLERACKKKLPPAERLRIAAEVGSDLPLFLVGGTVLGVGRGEEVYPVPDLPVVAMVVVVPEVGVSTPRAFADWDGLVERDKKDAERGSRGATELRLGGRARTPVAPSGRPGEGPPLHGSELTHAGSSDTLFEVGCALSAWLTGSNGRNNQYPNTGASAKSGSRAGNLLSDLVRTGIENDFEKVVFPQYPELRDVKGALARAGAKYASLSGSGSTLFGLFSTADSAAKAANRLRKQGLNAMATRTVTRSQYWKAVVGR